MQKIFKIDNSKIYMAPVKLLENYIFPELESRGMRMQASGYKFLTCATSDGESGAVLDSIDFFATSANGETRGYMLSVSRTVINNFVTESRRIAESKQLTLKAIEKYNLYFSTINGSNEKIMSAKDFVDYVTNKFFE